MKRILNKKLVLNKNTISNLSDDEMEKIWGATAFLPCTESCSAFLICCDPITEKRFINDDNDQG